MLIVLYVMSRSLLSSPPTPRRSSDERQEGPVLSGDEVHLVHAQTKRLLNSHDVAAPLSPALQEVAGYINYSAQFVPYFSWKLVRTRHFVIQEIGFFCGCCLVLRRNKKEMVYIWKLILLVV